MLRAPEPFLLLIADVSGYTSYLTGNELDHAQDILSDLLVTVSTRLEPPLQLVSVEGDACFLVSAGTSVGGQLLLDALDACYFAFRRRLRDIGQATSCRCDACIRIPSLDLKFVAHYGQAVRQRVGRQENVAGSSVIAVHRLLKNSIAEVIGSRGYAFFSDDCAHALGLSCGRMGMIRHAETTDVGLIEGYVADMRARWELEDRRIDRRLRDDQVVGIIETVLPGPPPVVWEWLTSPARRPLWQEGVTGIRLVDSSGRMEDGSTNHCMHGPDAMVEQILEWRPFDTLTDRSVIPGVMTLTTTFELTRNDDGTRVVFKAGGLESPQDREAWVEMGPYLRDKITADFARLADLMRAEAGSME